MSRIEALYKKILKRNNAIIKKYYAKNLCKHYLKNVWYRLEKKLEKRLKWQ